jgi:hypothetical protein
MQAVSEVGKQSFQAVVATYDWNGKRNPPMHEGLAEIKITLHKAEQTPSASAVLVDDEWIDLNELDGESSDSAVEILEPGEALTKDIVDEARMRVWLRFAGYGLL